MQPPSVAPHKPLFNSFCKYSSALQRTLRANCRRIVLPGPDPHTNVTVNVADTAIRRVLLILQEVR